MRATKLAGCGLQRGLRVSVLTKSAECAHVFDDPDLLSEVAGAEILRVSDGTDYRFRSAASRRLGYYPTRAIDKFLAKSRARWADDCYRAARRRWDGDRPDLVYCTPPGAAVVTIAQRLSEAWDTPFIMDFRDPPWAMGMQRGHVQRALDACDLAIFNTPPAMEKMRGDFPGHALKMECWTNGTDPVSENINLLPANETHRPLRLLFPGGIYPWVVDAIAALASHIADETLQVDVYGFREAKRRAELRQLERLGANLRAPVPSRELARLMRETSANLVTLPPGYQISSKVFPMIASGRALLVYGATEASRALLDDVPGVYSYGRNSSCEEIADALRAAAGYEPAANWPQRRRWLLPRTWPRIFDGIFGRYLCRSA